MSAIFTVFFVEDKESPQYTACVSVLIFNELQRYGIIETNEKVASKDCRWNNDFMVPNEYTPVDDTTGHCLSLSYRYTGDTGRNSFKGRWIKEICNKTICTGISDPNNVQSILIECTRRYVNCLPIDPPKSVLASIVPY
jgi:hypothetical protein